MKKTSESLGRFQQIKSMVEIYLSSVLVELVLVYVKNADYSKNTFNRLRLSRQQQEEVNYEEADLENSHLMHSQFFYCSFLEANLINATLFHVLCIDCDFIRAEMTNANLECLISSENAPLNFRGARLVEAHLKKSLLPGAVFSYANCSQADFSGTNLTGAHFYRTCLLGAKLSAAILTDTVLSQYPKNFFTILEKSETTRSLLINLLEDYIGAGSLLNMGNAFLTRKHFFPVRKILTGKKSHVDEMKQLGIWKTELEKLPREPDNDSLAARLEFTQLCSWQI